MKIVYATDLHGIKDQYLELLENVLEQEARVLILGGDLLPIDGPFERSLADQAHFIRAFLDPTFRAFSRNHPRVRVYWLHGNNDWAVSLEPLHQLVSETNGLFLHNRIHALPNGFQLIGYAHVPPTPFRIKDHERLDHRTEAFLAMKRQPYTSAGTGMVPIEQSRHFSSHPTIREELARLPLPADPKKTVYVMHSPPRDSALDRMSNGQPAGSSAIREFLEQHQPGLALHGHIHEAPEMSGHYWDRIGTTFCVNPGHSSAHLHLVRFDLEEAAATIRHNRFSHSQITPMAPISSE